MILFKFKTGEYLWVNEMKTLVTVQQYFPSRIGKTQTISKVSVVLY